jgi:hypothetical protein
MHYSQVDDAALSDTSWELPVPPTPVDVCSGSKAHTATSTVPEWMLYYESSVRAAHASPDVPAYSFAASSESPVPAARQVAMVQAASSMVVESVEKQEALRRPADSMGIPSHARGLTAHVGHLTVWKRMAAATLPGAVACEVEGRDTRTGELFWCRCEMGRCCNHVCLRFGTQGLRYHSTGHGGVTLAAITYAGATPPVGENSPGLAGGAGAESDEDDDDGNSTAMMADRVSERVLIDGSGRQGMSAHAPLGERLAAKVDSEGCAAVRRLAKRVLEAKRHRLDIDPNHNFCQRVNRSPHVQAAGCGAAAAEPAQPEADGGRWAPSGKLSDSLALAEARDAAGDCCGAAAATFVQLLQALGVPCGPSGLLSVAFLPWLERVRGLEEVAVLGCAHR